ncbi:MAG TPA: FAD-binding oxidoreductase [Terriglobia bacterium]|nr:FAD-binding oxidoreductase [Terriglobia bacterium]
MPPLTVTNWFGDLVSHPQVVVEAHSLEDIIAILKDPVKYPSPVRAIGSNHSTAPCGVVEGGTLIQMSGMNQVRQIGADTVTCQAGALYIDVAQELEKRNLQFYVNTEIGNLSLGSAACCGTKDGSMPGEYGQVGSYLTEVEMVLPSGEILEVDESQPELLQQIRSSYGLFGIVTAATFRVRPILPMAVYHETFTLEDFVQKLPELFARNESMMYYVFPFDNLITVEFRKYNPGAAGPPNRVIWPLRNYLWGSAGPAFCRQVAAEVSDPATRNGVIDGFCAMWRFKLTNLIRSDNSLAPEQMIRYPHPANQSSYTFSFWAIPEARFAEALTGYFKFSCDYYQQKGYRTNMLSVGYRVAKDQQSLLSYSFDGNAMTVDPVSTANPGWEAFLDAYNELCSNQGGIPLPNQTARVTAGQVQKGLGDRLKLFAQARKKYDPTNRLLNGFFKDVLGE